MSTKSEEMERKVTHQILAVWSGRKKEWLTYKEIVGEMKGRGVSERTVGRYLLALAREGKLERDERGYKRVFYRPREGYLETLRSSRDYIRMKEESLCGIGKYVIDTMIETVRGSEEVTKRIQASVEDGMKRMPEDEIGGENFDKMICDVLAKEGLTQKQRDEFLSLLELLVKGAFKIYNPYVFGRIADPAQLSDILDDDVWEMIKSYMHLWAYMYEHPATMLELEKYKVEFREVPQT